MSSPSKKTKLEQSGQLTSDRPQIAILDFGSQFSYVLPPFAHQQLN